MYREILEERPDKKPEIKSETVFGWEPLDIWPHQAAAVHTVREYIRAFNKGEVGDNKASLIQMPTGTGKTGVAAVLSMCFKDLPVSLILTPRCALKKQMIRDIKRKFWHHIDIDPRAFKKYVTELLPKNAGEKLNKIDHHGAVLVGTPQTLLQLKKEYPETFEKLREKVSLTIFDEGHYEPADNWKETVEILKKPTVLLSATPFRNDFRLFPVHPAHTYTYTFSEAISDLFLRDAAFKSLPKNLDIKSFAGELVHYFQGEFLKLKPAAVTEPRIIVRCETFEEVEMMTHELQALGHTTVGIHHRFIKQDNERHCYARVDDVPGELNATFWVHQFKLMEGIDDESFCLLAVYASPKNDRSIVQQIGRIIRNRKREPGQFGFVFYCKPTGVKSAWERYLKADRELFREMKRARPGKTYKGMANLDPDLPERLVVAQQRTEYIRGHFRTPFDIKAADAYKCLSLPKCACIFQVEPKMKNTEQFLEEIKNKTVSEWENQNRSPVSPANRPDKNTRVILYIAYRNSPLLQDDWYYIEYKLGATIIHWEEPFLFYYDSGRLIPEAIAKLEQKLKPEDMKQFFPNGNSRLISVNLANTNLGIKNFRSRGLRNFSLSDSIHGIEDHLYICKSVSGYVGIEIHEKVDKNIKIEKDIRRHVAFRSKQVREASGKGVTFDEYMKWLGDISHTLKQKKEPSGVFDRFATSFIDEMTNYHPSHILLDVYDVEDKFIDVDDRRHTLNVDDISANVRLVSHSKKSKYVFDCRINNEDFEIDVSYNPEKNRYTLTHPGLNERFRHKYDDKLGIVSYLNRRQAFRIVPQEPGIIYAYGSFYKPALCLGKDYNGKQLDFCRLFHGEKRLEKAGSEKGKINPGDGISWEKNSVFNIIDSARKTGAFGSLLKDIDTLICDDMGTEVADFIAAKKATHENSNEEEKVILIHAKAFSDPLRFSASKFADVCSQVVKNLYYVHPFATSKPPNLHKWQKEWKISKKVNGIKREYCVNTRIRLFKGREKPDPKPGSEEVWEYIRRIARNPLAKIEVWIVLGKGISKSELMNTYLKEDPPKAEIIQNIYQLESTWSIVTRMGATLRIFTRP